MISKSVFVYIREKVEAVFSGFGYPEILHILKEIFGYIFGMTKKAEKICPPGF